MSNSGDCGKCGAPLWGYPDATGPQEVWCQRCRQEHRDEYRPIYTSWIESHKEELLASMDVPQVYQSCSLNGFEAKTQDQKRALQAAREWLTSELPGLFLCGPCGTGKTHLATGALLAMRKRRYAGRFVSAGDLLFKFRNSFREGDGPEELMNKYCKPPVLLLDDLGAERPTDFSRETLGLLIDRVYRRESCLIVTSNFDLSEIAERIDNRTADRLVGMCLAVKLAGTSFRKKRALERVQLRNLDASNKVSMNCGL